ncbi:MAG TPA: replicative DNA helicase, partial [Patescibacteria group bacterium]|nr:replicative DNA helicase [Patescibacteria group bacterium]
LRQLIDAGTEIAGDAFVPEGRSSHELLETAEQRVFRIAEAGARGRKGFVTMGSAVKEAFAQLQHRYENKGSVTGLATGLRDFDEMTAGLQPSDLIILAARPSMGKCLAHDAELLRADGSMATIETICRERGGNVGTLQDDLRIARAVPSDYIDDGVKPVFEVTTRLGRQIETTAPHPFLTLDGWKPLHQLCVGDYIAVPRQLSVFGDLGMRDCEIALVAYLIGDGGLTGNAPRFTTSNPEIRDDFLAAVDAFGGVAAHAAEARKHFAPSWRIAANSGERAHARSTFAERLCAQMSGQGCTSVALAQRAGVSPASVSLWRSGRTVPDAHRLAQIARVLEVAPEALLPVDAEHARRNQPNALTRWLRELGLMGCNVHGKSIPACIFRLPRAQMTRFLGCLFATDGWATVLATGQAQLGYASVSERLARQIQHLLLRFGIIAKLRQRWVKYRDARRCSWQLDITDSASILAFCAEIPVPGKGDAFAAASRAAAQRRRQTNVDLVPAGVWERIAAAKGAMSWAELARRAGYNDGNSHLGRRALSRIHLARIALVLQDQGLTALASSDVLWDRIDSIVAAGNKQVYDLTIPETHNFIANDICVHNTALALNMAEYAAIKGKKAVAVFSMEMSASQLAFRLISSLGRINQQHLRTGELEDADWPRVTSAIQLLKDAKIFIDDTPALSPGELRARARRLKREHDLGLIVIDYLQLMAVPGTRENRATEISEISRSLKALAKELNVPVIALSQLNRSLEQRTDKRPVMADLRESGAIEQDADVIVFIYRDDYYNKESPDKGLAEIIIGKQRNGPTGTCKLTFLGHYTKFENHASAGFAGSFE